MNFWDRLQAAAGAAVDAWRGVTKQTMPSATGVDSLYRDLDREHKERVDLYNAYWRYYSGEHKKHLKRQSTADGYGPDDNVTINISRRTVNKGVAFLFGRPLHWELTEGDTTPEEELLDSAWRSQEWRQVFFQELAKNGGVTGDAYIQIVPPVEPFPGLRGDSAYSSGQLPRIINVNPLVLFPYTDPDDIDNVLAFEYRMRAQGKLRRQIHSKREDGLWETWTEQITGQNRWNPISDVDIWPFEFPMYVHIKNMPNPNTYFGESDLVDADLNDAINSVASNLQRVTRIFSHPQVWGRMFKPSDFMDVSKIALSQSPDAVLSALELTGNLNGVFDYVRFLRSINAEITQVPEMDPDRLRLGAQSGFALRILYGDLIDKTETKRNLYGMGLVETNRRLLSILGLGDDFRTTLHWEDPLPIDESSEMKADQFDLDAKLASRETMQRKRGYDPDVERERIEIEQAQTGNLGAELLRQFERGNTNGFGEPNV